MGLKNRILAGTETLREFEDAAVDTHAAALSLIGAGHNARCAVPPGVCSGNAAQKCLFRLQGARTQDAVVGFLIPARNFMRVHYPSISHEGHHNLWFWTLCLRHRRRLRGSALAAEMDWKLVQHGRRLYQNWSVSLRYRNEPPLPNELIASLEAVAWLRRIYPTLWS